MVSWQTAGDALHKKSNSVKSAQICSNPQFPADLVTFTEKIVNGNFIFCAVWNVPVMEDSLFKTSPMT